MAVDKSEARVRQMFGQIAPRYDLLNHVLSWNVDRYWRHLTTKLLPPEGDQPILDVCTGTGDLILAYARQVPPHTPLVASDFCHEMLTIAREKSKKQQRNVSFLEADTQHLPFSDNQFSRVVVGFGLRNVTNTERGLAEMLRVCRPGGKVGILEFSQTQFSPLSWCYRLYFKYLLPLIGQTLARNQSGAYSYLPKSVQEFPSGEELAKKMRAMGYQDVGYKPLTLGIVTLYWGTKCATP